MSSQPAFYWSKQTASAVYDASITKDGTSANNMRYATEGTVWGPGRAGAEWITIDNGEIATFDTLCLLGNNLSGQEIRITASTDNFVSTEIAIAAAEVLPDSVNANIRSFTASTYRYWKVYFSSAASNIEVAHVAFDLQVLLPFFEIDPDEDGIEPTATHLISKGGLYLGTAQDKAETKMPLQFGEISPADLPALQSWADANIREVHPFFLQVDSSVSRVHFGRLSKGGRWGAPLQTGVNVVRNNTFETRAA